jgi:selenocysteine-specific translation elongation factor
MKTGSHVNIPSAHLNRIEQKLDRLLTVIAPALPSADIMQSAAFASGGIEGLKAYQKAKVEQDRRSK